MAEAVTAFSQGVDIELTARQARKLIMDELEQLRSSGLSIPYDKVTAKTVDFSDLARAKCVFVTVHGWKPNRSFEYLKAFAIRHGFRLQVEGPGIIQ